MAGLKVIIFLLIISSIYVDARSRRKRRQLSSSSYYISNINPYSPTYNPTVPLTYPSGSYYSAPVYGYPNTGYSADRPYDPNYFVEGYDAQFPYAQGQVYQYQNLGSTYGSGYYSPYMSGLNGYAISGFNNVYPNWNQGNYNQYFTGGTGNGLVLSGYNSYRSALNNPAHKAGLARSENNNPSIILNSLVPMKKSAQKTSSRK